MNFPTDIFQEVPLSADLLNGFKASPMAAYKGKTDYLLVFEKESMIREMQPDFDKISKLASRGVIVTARGENSDFVSRFFAPAVGINEDPVTGSAHTTLIPYWSKILGKETLTAFQLSDRTGILYCKMLGDRVEISGYASLYLKGEIYI
jgi:predicted PhzF superfamily epimerase YddE/YHI9